MTEDRQNLLLRREILLAYVKVLERPHELFDVCAAVSGDGDDLRAAVGDAFELDPIAADAVLALQVRRFTPRGRKLLQDELADLDLRIAETGG